MRAGTSSSKHARCVQYMIVLRIYPAGLALPGNQVSTQDLLPRRRAAACRLQEAEREIAAANERAQQAEMRATAADQKLATVAANLRCAVQACT